MVGIVILIVFALVFLGIPSFIYILFLLMDLVDYCTYDESEDEDEDDGDGNEV